MRLTLTWCLTGGYLRVASSTLNVLRTYPGMSAALDKLDFNPLLTMRTYQGDILMGPRAIVDPRGLNSGTTMFRSSLVQVLYNYVRALGIEFTFNKKAEFFYENPTEKKSGCVTGIGEKFEADLVIAADGIGSRAARLVMGKNDVKAVSSGFSVFRCTFPTSKIAKLHIVTPNLI
jgi:2-polyprenyl-6-methoxyphenol hydroxylase-like FAD-dependent oxidoreductase